MAELVDWSDAECLRLPVEVADRIWFPSPASRRAADFSDAVAACGVCPLQEPCLDLAMAAEHRCGPSSRYGVYAGLTPVERWQLDPDAVALSADLRRRVLGSQAA